MAEAFLILDTYVEKSTSHFSIRSPPRFETTRRVCVCARAPINYYNAPRDHTAYSRARCLCTAHVAEERENFVEKTPDRDLRRPALERGGGRDGF